MDPYAFHAAPGTRQKRKRACPRCGAWLGYRRPLVNGNGAVITGGWRHPRMLGDLLGNPDQCEFNIIDNVHIRTPKGKRNED